MGPRQPISLSLRYSKLMALVKNKSPGVRWSPLLGLASFVLPVPGKVWSTRDPDGRELQVYGPWDAYILLLCSLCMTLTALFTLSWLHFLPLSNGMILPSWQLSRSRSGCSFVKYFSVVRHRGRLGPDVLCHVFPCRGVD